MANRPDLYRRWSLEMRRAGLFRPGERVGVAVSGGPDSVLLLEFMRGLERDVGLRLAAVHFNHRLRGIDSDGDEGFVRGLAERLGIEFIRAAAEVAQCAEEKRWNLEATARALRYQFFFSLLNQGRLDKVATAHTANDQAETVLLRLLRGTGTRGLAGIYPVLEGKIVRPFLNLMRSEVEGELGRRKLEWRVDATNRDVRLRRNKIRMELLPLLEQQFNPEMIRLLKELADRARDDEAYLEEQARERGRPWRVREAGEERIPLSALVEFPPAIARRVLRQMVLAALGNLRGLTHAHIEAVRHFAHEGQSGKRLFLPQELVVRKEFDWLVVGRRSPEKAQADFSYRVDVPSEVTLPLLGLSLRFQMTHPEEMQKAYNEKGVVGLDRRKLQFPLVLRNWRAGDRFHPAGSLKGSKLKELFRERRIPVGQRKLWPVLVSGKKIVWVRGFPPAADVAASPECDEVLVIQESPMPAAR